MLQVARMRAWALAALLFITAACKGGGGLASPEAGAGGDDAAVGAADHPVVLDGPAALDAGGTSDVGGTAEAGGTAEVGGAADAGAATDARTCSDKAPACGPGQVCDLDQPGRCAASTVGGTCIVKPSICPFIYDPVCGCDGRTYGSDCARQSAGVQLDHRGACGGASVQCGSVSCSAGQLCVHLCTCGGPAPTCEPAPDGGPCPVGTAACRTPGGVPGCARACMNPPAHCGAAAECPVGMRDSTGQLICPCPP
jgi:hypothetical protein